MVVNGRVAKTQLTTVFPGAVLLNSVAVAVKNLTLIAALDGTKVTAAGGYGSAFRDLSDQSLFLRASKGDAAAVRELRSRGTSIDSRMTTSVGSVGFQSHGWADRIDLLFDGRSPDSGDLALARQYGGVQEFGDADRNHFRFAPSRGVSEKDKNRIVCAWLNRRNLGQTSNTDKDGTWPAESKFSWMLQAYGLTRKGWYTPGVYKHDGIRGPRTIWIRDQLWNALWTR